MLDNISYLVVVGMLGVFLVIALMIVLQIRNQNKLLHQQRKLSEAEVTHQKNLLEAVITSQEAERQRIGSDLHDEVGSVLSSLRLLIEKNSIKEQQEESFGIQSKQLIDRVITQVRQISHNLSPRITGSYGFYDAVYELADTVNQSGKMHLELDFDESIAQTALPDNAAMAIYRVLAELINNTIKHAQASMITIRVTINQNKLNIYYGDDGVGIASEKTSGRGMGMRNIESRLSMIDAIWQFEQKKGKGFIMEIFIPLILL